MIENREYIQEFVDEANGHIETLESILVHVDEMKNNPDLINEVFRAVHSIKGTAGFFGLKNIVGVSHAMENIFGEIRNQKLQMNDEMADLLLKSNDCLKELVGNVDESENVSVDSCINELNQVLNPSGSAKFGSEKDEISIRGKNGGELKIYGANALLLRDGISLGHKIYEIKLRINRDLLNYDNGPVTLVKRIQQNGQLIDTVADYSEIGSLEDVLSSINGEANDIYLGIIITSDLEADQLAEAIRIPEKNIAAMDCETKAGSAEKAKPENAAKAPVPAQTEKAEPPLPADGAAHQPAKLKTAPVKADDSIRVNVQILNDLLNMASEMVLGRNQLLRTLENYKKSIPGLVPILQNIDRLTSGLQEKIMQTRMQPVSNVFNKFPRIIRDISRKLQKEIELKIEGSDVELDKSMIESLADPLTHIVRNSADHGIESPEEREKAGKSRIGNILLKAYHEGGFVNIDVFDDGGGLDVEKIKKKAVESGLINRSEFDKMSEQDVFKLIFKPGFSTSEKITDISGRGVGMDVVKTNVEKLGGSIEIYSSKGKGTTIRLVLPLTLAIIQSLIVEDGGQTFALPQVNMQEIVRVKGENSGKIESINGINVFRLRGKLLPIIFLEEILGITATGDEEESEPRSAVIIVFKTGVTKFGLVVHSIVESEETLVKPLPQALKDCVCYSGVTILGDGKAAMILDPEGILKSAKLKNSGRLAEETSSDPDMAGDNGREQQNLLLFQCSGNETFALDMSLVARVEEITQEQIERVGSREFLQYRGDALRIVRPEDFLPVNRAESAPEKMYVIIPKLVKYPMGILVNQIVDNIKTVVNLSTKDFEVKGLLGSMILNEKIVLLLQLYEFFALADPEHYSAEIKKADCEYRLLLAEDTPFFQRVTKEYLEEAGYRVTVACNGKEAWEKLSVENYDAVISDINMPVMDGLELARRIKDHPSLKGMPVIALTSLTGENNETKGIAGGFDYYECKLDRDHLLDTLNLALNKKNGGESTC